MRRIWNPLRLRRKIDLRRSIKKDREKREIVCPRCGSDEVEKLLRWRNEVHFRCRRCGFEFYTYRV